MVSHFSRYINSIVSRLMDTLSPIDTQCTNLSRPRYCGGFSLYRGGFVPSVLLGPTVNVTLETGNCTLVWSDDYSTKSVVCTSPSVSYVKVLWLCEGQLPVEMLGAVPHFVSPTPMAAIKTSSSSVRCRRPPSTCTSTLSLRSFPREPACSRRR